MVSFSESLSSQSKRFANTRSGLSLVELMVVIAITGVLVAISTRAYRDYQVRARNLAAYQLGKRIIDLMYTAQLEGHYVKLNIVSTTQYMLSP